VRENGIKEAEAYLLERSGAVHEAMELQLQIFTEKLNKLISNLSIKRGNYGEKSIYL